MGGAQKEMMDDASWQPKPTLEFQDHKFNKTVSVRCVWCSSPKDMGTE